MLEAVAFMQAVKETANQAPSARPVRQPQPLGP
jgi:hypothetical protein